MSPETNATIAYRDDRPSFFSLPFCGEDRNYWDIPLRGGYFGGRETGEALGFAYARYVSGQDKEDQDAFLRDIVFSMARAMARTGAYLEKDERTTEGNTLRGQVCGFFDVLDHYLFEGLRNDQPVKELSEEAILHKANQGINLDEAAYLEFLEKREAIAALEKQFEPKLISFD